MVLHTDNQNNNWPPVLTAASYPAVYSLLVPVARAFSADEACLISPSGDSSCVVLASSTRSQPEQTVREYARQASDVSTEISFGGRTLGELVLVNPASEVDRQQLGAFADALGFALTQAQQLSDAESLIEESKLLRELGLQLGEQSNLEAVLGSVTKSVRRLLNADYASMAIAEADGSTRWATMDGALEGSNYGDFVFPPGKGVAGRTVLERKPIVLEGMGKSPELPVEEFRNHVAQGGVSVLGVPLLSGGQALGALIIGSRTPRQWKKSEIEVASAFANTVAVLSQQARISAEERNQRAFLEKILDSFPGILLVSGPPPDFQVVLINRRLTSMLPEPYRSGISPIGLPISALVDPNSAAQGNNTTLDIMREVYETGKPVSYEQYESRSPQLGVTYWNWTVVAVGGEAHGDKRYVMVIAQDISEAVLARKKEQLAAETAQARAQELETVIQQMAEGVIIFGPGGEIVKINPEGERLLGRGVISSRVSGSRAEIYGLYKPGGQPFASEELPSVRALAGQTVTGEHMVVKRPNGEEIILRASVSPLTDSAGHITGAIGVFHDVTREKMVERMKDDFLSVVSHELRTPLSAIMGYSDLLLRGTHGSLNERQAKSLGAVRSNADRLLHMINDLLDVSKLEAGAVEVNVAPVGLGDVVSRTLAQTRVLAQEAGVALHNYIPQRPLPPVLADEPKLQQIIENLLSNAIKFTPPGGTISFDATTSSLAADDQQIKGQSAREQPQGQAAPRSVVVSVTDTGAGLEQDQLERIWDRFYQVDTTAKRRFGGAGLGLAIVRSLVEMQGGQVWVRSEGPQRGSTFSFSLPLALAQVLPEPAGSANRSRYISRAGAGKSSTVLVAEDDADQREIICEMLEAEGYNVALAEDGQQALEMASSLHPQAVILDVILPRSDGWQVLQQLKDDPQTRDIPVLIVSVVDQTEFGKKLGAHDYLLKPLEAVKLRQAIRRITGKYRPRVVRTT